MNGAEVLLRTLLGSGIDVSFMNPGTSEMQFVAALDRVPGMRGVLCLFEGVCSGAADGYARMLGRPASTLLHLGPGLANGLANFHNARKARSPVVSVVGEHSTQHMQYDAPLSADIAAFARAVSDDIVTPGSAAEMGAAAAAAIEAARRPPGQIAHLIVPADYSWSEAGLPLVAPAAALRREPSDATLRQVADVLRHGAAVTFVLGGATLTDRGLQAAGRLAASFGVRVCANRNAPRLQSGQGRFQPVRIPYFPEPAEELLAGTRYLVLVESAAPVSFFGYPEQRSYLAPDDAEVLVLASTGEDGSAALSLLAELAGAREAPVLRRAGPPPLPSPSEALTPETIAHVVAHMLPDHAIVVDEAISSAEPLGRHLLCAAPHDFLPVTGGSIGQGLPVAVGAAVACPDRTVVALEADGSAMYTLQALWTMARERLDVVTVIYNNRRYRILDVEMQRTGAHGFGPVANGMIDIGRPNMDFVKLSEGLGVAAARAATVGELATQLAESLRRPGPRVVEALMV